MPIFDPIFRNWICGVELVIRRGVHYLSFKDGIFQLSIPSQGPYTQEVTKHAFNTLLALPSISFPERRTLTTIRDLYTRLLTTHGADFSLAVITSIKSQSEHVVSTMLVPNDDHARMATAIEALEDMFDADRSKRGIRVPSRGYQFVGAGGEVKKTIFFDVDRHQLVVEGDYFKKVEMVESLDYYEVPRGGPDGLTLRYLTARFMMTQGCQTPEYNDLAFCAQQKAEVMQYIQTQGPFAIPTALDPNNQPLPFEDHRLREPAMLIRASKLILRPYNTMPLPVQTVQSNNTPGQNFSCSSLSSSKSTLSSQPPKKKKRSRHQPLAQPHVRAFSTSTHGLDMPGFRMLDFAIPGSEIPISENDASAGLAEVDFAFQPEPHIKSEDRTTPVARSKGKAVSAAVDTACHKVGAAITRLKDVKARLV